MSYTNLVFFALSLLIYLTYIPHDEGNIKVFSISFTILVLGYSALTWFAYSNLRRKIEKRSHPIVQITPIANALEKKFILLALFLYFYLIYNSGFKNIIWRISFLKESPFLDLALGIFPFLLFLTILWTNSFVLFQASLEAKIKRKTYLFSQIRLNALILLPVFLPPRRSNGGRRKTPHFFLSQTACGMWQPVPFM